MLRVRCPVDRLQRSSENVCGRVRNTLPQQECAGQDGRAGRLQLSDAALPSAIVSYRFQLSYDEFDDAVCRMRAYYFLLAGCRTAVKCGLLVGAALRHPYGLLYLPQQPGRYFPAGHSTVT